MKTTCFFTFLLIVLLALSGCATTQETTELRSGVSSVSYEFEQYKNTSNAKLANIEKENERLSKQIVNLSTSMESKEDKIKNILGKLDELEHQLQVYWNETKADINTLKKLGARTETTKTTSGHQPQESQVPPRNDEGQHEAVYKDAFDTFQRGLYDEAINKFSDFIKTYPETSLVPNAYYWMGEGCLGIKDYEKAILHFQEVIDKFPKSDKASNALLSQAEAFSRLKDEKSSITIMKKIIELYPKSEEAVIAERRLRNLNTR
jgi:tol-pal system protein YbgF